jgi:glycine cleavage system H lipoate-binding protein
MASFSDIYPTPLERQFNRYYHKDSNQYAHLHKNKSVTMIGLAPNHPAVLEGVAKVEFSKAAATNEALGKKKRGALGLRPETLICTLESKQGSIFQINARVNMDLVEINQRLLNQPELVSSDPEGAGFLCVGLIRLETNMNRCYPGFELGGSVMSYRNLEE